VSNGQDIHGLPRGQHVGLFQIAWGLYRADASVAGRRPVTGQQSRGAGCDDTVASRRHFEATGPGKAYSRLRHSLCDPLSTGGPQTTLAFYWSIDGRKGFPVQQAFPWRNHAGGDDLCSAMQRPVQRR